MMAMNLWHLKLILNCSSTTFPWVEIFNSLHEVSKKQPFFLISRLLQQDHYKFDLGMTAVELLFPLMKTQFFRSRQAIVSFGIKLADPETFNKF